MLFVASTLDDDGRRADDAVVTGADDRIDNSANSSHSTRVPEVPRSVLSLGSILNRGEWGEEVGRGDGWGGVIEPGRVAMGVSGCVGVCWSMLEYVGVCRGMSGCAVCGVI